MRIVLVRRNLLLLLLALVALLPVFAAPSARVSGPIYRYLFVIDVTQSMNVRDHADGDGVVARLEAAKQAVLDALGALPCGSVASVGLFAEQETLVLFDPLETCAHYPAMEQVVRGIDWRMAWSGNSEIPAGLLSAMQQAQAHGLDLVFLTDGDQAPYRDQLRLDKLHAGRDEVHGVVVGVGGEQERPIPKLDAGGGIVGWWQAQDAIRNGFHPNMETVADGFEPPAVDARDHGPREHRSALRPDVLRQVADAAGLEYRRLSGSALRVVVLNPQFAGVGPAIRDLRGVFALLCAALLLASTLTPDRRASVGQIRHTRVAATTQPTAASASPARGATTSP